MISIMAHIQSYILLGPNWLCNVFIYQMIFIKKCMSNNCRALWDIEILSGILFSYPTWKVTHANTSQSIVRLRSDFKGNTSSHTQRKNIMWEIEKQTHTYVFKDIQFNLIFNKDIRNEIYLYDIEGAYCVLNNITL